MAHKFKLPEGWTSEVIEYTGTVLKRPDGGYVTIDFEERLFEAGMCRPMRHHMPDKNAVYVARGWQDRLVADAIGYLERLMA